MNVLELFNKGGLFVSQADNYQDLFKEFDYLLTEMDYVQPQFLDEVIKREKLFPTGIEGGKYNIALPHVDACYVKENALFIARLINETEFVKMDDHSRTVDVKLVFFLLIHNLELHVGAISELTKIWTNDKIMDVLLQAKDKSEALELLQQEL